MKTLNNIFLILMLSAVTMCIGSEEQGLFFKKSKLENQSLFDLVERGDLKACQSLIARGADVNEKNEEESIPLHWAAFYGNVALSKLFLEEGADVNSLNNSGVTPLYFFAYKSKIKMSMKYLGHTDLNKVNKDQYSKLLAIDRGYVEGVALQLVYGADVDLVVRNSGEKEVETIQRAVEGIIDVTFNFKRELKPASLVSLCCIREYCENSLLHNDFLPFDMFKVIKKQAEKLSLSFDQVEKLIIFFKNNGYQDNDSFIQKLEQYKNN
ncbi:MAG: ankyrin repeat domain-containing protein [Candidatus Babeliales bacterium]